uniref:Uncharacterized protein n=1 Tax=Gossypium raimondii TaxID=29730 RepID=A0A0D2TSJ2_GOSRA|nr:hypothetical protein B456_007G368900 [Gossypium raimondii]
MQPSIIILVLNFSSYQSGVAFLHGSSFRSFINILVHFKGWQLDSEKMSSLQPFHGFVQKNLLLMSLLHLIKIKEICP